MRKTHSHKYLKYVFQQILQWVWLLRRFASLTNGHAWSDPSEADAAMFVPVRRAGHACPPKILPMQNGFALGAGGFALGADAGRMRSGMSYSSPLSTGRCSLNLTASRRISITTTPHTMPELMVSMPSGLKQNQ